jgi:hypothetical protein
MAWTLLDYQQHILSSLDSDEINNWNDTVEAEQIARLIHQCYEDVVARADMPEHYGLYELEASTDGDKPTLMTLPETSHSLEWVKYDRATVDDTRKNFFTVKYLPVDQFMARQTMLDESDDNVETFDHTMGTSSVTFKYNNDRAPEFYTTPDDRTLFFDSYDAEVDSTLQKTKSLAYGKLAQEWSYTNTFVPFLDPEFSVLLLNEAKALAFAELKQTEHPRAERTSRRLWVDNQKKKRSVDRNRDELARLPNYGRK